MRDWAIVALCLAMCLLGFYVGRMRAKMPGFGDVIIEVDTLVVRDTFVAVMPSPVSVREVGSFSVPVQDTSRIDGMLVMRLPKMSQVYESPRFRAEVSGYMPSLDRLEIYGENRQVTRTIRQASGRNTLALGVEPMWVGGFHVPVMADYSRAVLPWLDIGAGIGYDPVSNVPVIRASARIRFSW